MLHGANSSGKTSAGICNMQLGALLIIPLGFMCVFYGLRGKSMLHQGEQAVGIERAMSVFGGVLLIACGLWYVSFVFQHFSTR
jgi:hypothetical protein